MKSAAPGRPVNIGTGTAPTPTDADPEQTRPAGDTALEARQRAQWRKAAQKARDKRKQARAKFSGWIVGYHELRPRKSSQS